MTDAQFQVKIPLTCMIALPIINLNRMDAYQTGGRFCFIGQKHTCYAIAEVV